ncbi:unnamed protein product [Lactuca virosa]|uniref:Uncharacterized protein n=1 Tax=Lactuca virosa TaxID=75947 RepID=A0AAU9P0S6_9ASTR|nr:unnamed protein product [Lactuca virosa]
MIMSESYRRYEISNGDLPIMSDTDEFQSSDIVAGHRSYYRLAGGVRQTYLILSDAGRQLMLSFRHLIEFIRKMTGYGLTDPVNRKEYFDYSRIQGTIDIEVSLYIIK